MSAVLSDQERRHAAFLEQQSTEEILRRRRMHEEIVADPRALPVMVEASGGALAVIDLVLAKRAAMTSEAA